MPISRGALGAGLQAGSQGFMRALQVLTDMKRQKELDAQRVTDRDEERKFRDRQAAEGKTKFLLDADSQGYTPYEAPVGGGISGDIEALRELGTDKIVNTPTGSFRYRKPEDPVLARQRADDSRTESALAKLAEFIGPAMKGDETARANLLARNPSFASLWQPKPPVRGTPEYLRTLDDEERVKDRYDQNNGQRNIDPLSDDGIARSAQRAAAVLAAGGGGGAGAIREGELKNAAFFKQAEQAGKLLDGFEAPGIADAALSSIPVVGRFATSGKYQQLEQASMQLAEAWLRATSGAAVTESEVSRNAKMLLPLASDRPEVVEQKKKARQQIIESLRTMGGRAVTPAATPGTGAPRLLKPGEKPPGGSQ